MTDDASSDRTLFSLVRNARARPRTVADRIDAQPTQLGDVIQQHVPAPRELTTRQRRLILAADATQDDPETVLFQHSGLCQTGMPYRNPGEAVRVWERLNGTTHLQIMAGAAMHPEKRRLIEVGLPYGPKPRLILAHINGEALRQGTPEVEVDDSLTAFVKRLRLDAGGRTIGTIKDQLARLSASTIRLGIIRDGEAITVNSQIVSAFNIWFPKAEGQRVLWPSTVRLSLDYFTSLQNHAVPLHDRALAALSGSAMALDVYAWLAQRLHRIDPHRPAFVAWASLKEQFGWHYHRMIDFKRAFTQTTTAVHSQYRAARIELDGRGMTLRNSAPPVKGRTAIIV